MAQYSFQDFRNRIIIQDLAASLGYWVNTGAGTKQLSMCLGDRKAPTDEIIIYNYNFYKCKVINSTIGPFVEVEWQLLNGSIGNTLPSFDGTGSGTSG